MESFLTDSINLIKAEYEPCFFFFDQEINPITLIGSEVRVLRNCKEERYQVNLKTNLGTRECNIRKIYGPAETVCLFAKNELSAYSLLIDSPHFAKIVGFSISEEEQGRVSYKIAHEIFPMRLDDARNLSEDQKHKIIFNLYSALHDLSSKDLFHGALFLKNIFLDDQLNPKIKLSPVSRYFIFLEDNELLNYLQDLVCLEECDFNFLAPELILSLKLLKKHEMIQVYHPEKCDLYCVGMLSCYLLGFQPLNITFETSYLDYLDFNTKINSCPFESLSKSSDNLELMIDLNNFTIKFLYAMRFYEIEQLITNSIKFNHNERILIIDILNKNDSETEEVNQADKEFVMTLTRESAKVLTLIASSKFHDAGVLVNKKLLEYQTHFQRAYDIYSDTECTSKTIKTIEGIVLFFYHLFSLISTELEMFNSIEDSKHAIHETIREFQELIIQDIRGSTNFPQNFFDFFNSILKHNKITKNYIVQSLLIFKMTDWNYFFSSNLLNRIKFYKFSDYPVFVTEFNTLISKPIVAYVMQMFLPEKKSLENSIKMLIENTYIVNIFPSAAGFSTYNLFAFINSNLEGNLRKANIRYRTAIYIIMLHEFSHLLRRLNFNTFRDSKNALTPPNSQEDKKKIHRDDFQVRENVNRNKGEAGIKAETFLFGSKVATISRPAAVYLLSFEPDISLQKFKEEFFYHQSLEPESRIDVIRSSDRVRIPYGCGFSR